MKNEIMQVLSVLTKLSNFKFYRIWDIKGLFDLK